MPETVHCPACQALLRVADDLPEGTEVRCPRCGAEFRTQTPGVNPPPPPTRKAAEPEEPQEDPSAGRERVSTNRAEEEPPETPRTAASRRFQGDEDDDFQDRDDDRPRRRWEDDDDDDRPRSRNERKGLAGLTANYATGMNDWFAQAKHHYSAVFGVMIGYLMIVYGINIALRLAPFGGCVGLFIGPPLHAGFSIVALAQLRGYRWEFGDFFSGFSKFMELFIYTFLTSVLLFVVLLPGFFIVFLILGALEVRGDEAWVLGALISTPLLVPALYIYTRISTFATYLIVDRGCSGMAAIQGSWDLTKGHTWELMWIHILLTLFALGGLLLCLVGVLFVVPFIHLVWAAAYLNITGEGTTRKRRFEYEDGR